MEKVAQKDYEDKAYLVDSQVNFCAQAYPTVGYGHKDHVALSLLGIIMRHGYCHRAIREQGGAYGGGATQKALEHAFVFYSYRDPRIEGTFLTSMQQSSGLVQGLSLTLCLKKRN